MNGEKGGREKGIGKKGDRDECRGTWVRRVVIGKSVLLGKEGRGKR